MTPTTRRLRVIVGSAVALIRLVFLPGGDALPRRGDDRVLRLKVG